MSAQSRAHALVGYNPEGRPDDDFYPTPPIATESLLMHEKFGPYIWESACGDGAISKVLESHGHIVHSTDKVYRGYGLEHQMGDFFQTKPPIGIDAIVTNPPFKLLNPWIERCLDLGVPKFAIFAKLQALETMERTEILMKSPLKTVYVFRKRISLYRDGIKMKNGGMIAFCWMVWERGYDARTQLWWI